MHVLERHGAGTIVSGLFADSPEWECEDSHQAAEARLAWQRLHHH